MPRRFPLYGFLFQTPWLFVKVGSMWETDAFGVKLMWGRIHPLHEGDLAYRHEKRWVWWTAQDVLAHRDAT